MQKSPAMIFIATIKNLSVLCPSDSQSLPNRLAYDHSLVLLADYGRIPLSNPAANRTWPVPNGTHLGDQTVTDRRPESARPPDAGAFTDF